jgi:hypothetical protein
MDYGFLYQHLPFMASSLRRNPFIGIPFFIFYRSGNYVVLFKIERVAPTGQIPKLLFFYKQVVPLAQ